MVNIYAETDQMCRINEYSTPNYSKEKLIPKRYIPNYHNDGSWKWEDCSQSKFHTIRDYFEYQLSDGHSVEIGDIKYLPVLKNTSRNEYWTIIGEEVLRYVNGITGEVRFEMSFTINRTECVLDQSKNIPDFWKDFDNTGISIKNPLSRLELIQKENGEIDIIGKVYTENDEPKKISILELAKTYNKENMLESAVRETEEGTRQGEIDKQAIIIQSIEQAKKQQVQAANNFEENRQ